MSASTFSIWYAKWADQISHVGWGAALTLGLAQHMTHGYATLAVLAGVTIKEGVIDPLTETLALQGSGLEDWAFWCLGIIVGLAVMIH